jgi:hypothetical protein
MAGLAAGAARGGIVGAVNGAFLGVLFAPVMGMLAWGSRNKRGRFWLVLLMAVTGEAVVAYLLHVIVPIFAGWPPAIVIVVLTAFLSIAVSLPLFGLYMMQREAHWFTVGTRVGCWIGCICAAVLYFWIGLMIGAPVLVCAVVSIVAAVFVGMPVGVSFGGFLATTSRVMVRMTRGLIIQWRCHRHRQRMKSAMVAQHFSGLDLEDIESVVAAAPPCRQLAALLLEAFRDGVTELRLEKLGAFCKVTRTTGGCPQEAPPVLCAAAVIKAMVASLAVYDSSWLHEKGERRLQVFIGTEVVIVLARLGSLARPAEAVLTLTASKSAAARAIVLLREYHELVGDSMWNAIYPEVRFARNGASAVCVRKEQAEGALIRLVSQDPCWGKLARNPFEITLDGELLSTERRGRGFDLTAEAGGGYHVVQMTSRFSVIWRRTTFLLHVQEPGVYQAEFTINWFLGNCLPNVRVTDLTAEADGFLLTN